MPDLPDIHDFIRDGDWRHRFEEEVLHVAQKLRGKVRQLSGHWLDRETFVLRAEVHGHPCEITHWPNARDSWDAESTCPCEIQHDCPHAAAIYLAAEKPRKLAELTRAPDPEATLQPASALAPSDRSDAIAPTPEFHLHIRRESTEQKIVRLLLQALKLPDHGDWIVARPSVTYGDQSFPLSGKPNQHQVALDDGRVIQRDHAAEMQATQTLEQIGLSSISSYAPFRFLLALERHAAPSEHRAQSLWFPTPGHAEPSHYWPWLRTTGASQLEACGWSLAFDPDVGHEVIDLDPDDLDYHLSENPSGGWFHLSVGFDVEGSQLDLMPILADLLERGAEEVTLEFPADGHLFHHLDDGRALRIPADRIRRILKQFSALIDPQRFANSGLKIHPLDAANLAYHDPAHFHPPAKLQSLIHALESGHQPTARSATPPSGLQAELRDYQLAGFQWMQFLAHHDLHGILADDMGLGKTLQTLTHILAEKEANPDHTRPTLVVAPTSVVPNWAAEAKRFAPSLRILILSGPQRKKYYRSIPYADLVLTSYALLQRDIEALAKYRFHLAVLDEAQYIKNPAAKVAQAACKLDARHRLCLSGTPVENHLGELWSLMRFLMPGFLGTREAFTRQFRKPIEDHGDLDRQHALKARVAPLILRRNKDQVAKELPPKTILVHPVELNTAQKDLYETVRATMDKRVRQSIAIKGLDGSRMLFLEALLKLRQICCEPSLLKFKDELKLDTETAGSAKLDYLTDLLDTLIEEDRRVLIFSQFTTMLDLIAAHLNERRIRFLMLTGASKDRGKLVERFQTGEIPVFLISLKAGGTGLNLTAADTVIHYDPWWNPAAEAQATDRAYRIGQSKPVFVHKLICQGTVEERIHQLQQKKNQLADALLDDTDRATTPDESTLSQLLAPLDSAS